MRRDTSTGAVVFRCHCGDEEPGDPADARIFGAVLGAGETAEMYDTLVKHAGSDPVNQLVSRDCPSCKRDYAVQMRIGESESVIYACKCGIVTAAQGRESTTSLL